MWMDFVLKEKLNGLKTGIESNMGKLVEDIVDLDKKGGKLGWGRWRSNFRKVILLIYGDF